MTTAPPAVRERPIIFSAPMIREILAGRKTQTRRIVRLDAKTILSPGQRRIGFAFNAEMASVGDVAKWVCALAGKESPQDSQQISVPARHPGDASIPWEDCGRERVYCPYGGPGDRLWVVPSIHMPRWASRLTLELTGVRVQRLNEISEADAIAEGSDARKLAEVLEGGFPTAMTDFITRWEEIHGPGAWDANPWVWALTFKVLQPAAAS